jgi:dihydrolipoamide dehydrogenase
MEHFDVLVIGAGPGGYVAAIRAAQSGMKTAIVDKQWLGGVCLNVGCIPSKALLINAEVAHTLHERGRDFGFSFENLHLDYSLAVKRSRQVSDRLTKGVGLLMKKNEIEVLMGEAAFSTNNSVHVLMRDGTGRDVEAKNIIIATGSSPINIPNIEQDGNVILGFKDAILQDHLPTRVVIIGGGAIGVEFATIWSSYGVEVTIVEMLPHILPMEDDEVAQELTRSLTRRHVKILAGARVESVLKNTEGIEIQVNSVEGNESLKAEQVLVAVGFKPNTTGLNLEKIGVKVTPKGHVVVDERLATNVEGIWAIGDVTGKLLLAHVASAQALVCVDALNGMDIHPLDYTMIPRVTYCQPQVASIGLTEKQIREKNMDVKIGKFPFQANGKSLGLGESTGFVKLISETHSGKLVGAHLVGPEVAELLPELTLAQSNDLGIDAIARNIHAHPTLSEAVMEASHMIEGMPIHI